MKDKLKNIVHEQVHEATYLCLLYKIPDGSDIELYTDDIFRQTLLNLTTHFLKGQKLRDSEKETLKSLQKACNADTGLTEILRQLYRNLNQIKPAWGEFFGTNRGDVYDAFHYVHQWPCFTADTRNQIKSRQITQLHARLMGCQEKLVQQNNQLEEATLSIQHHEKTTFKAARRAASQFIQIQQLTMENKQLTMQLQNLQPKKHPQSDSLTTVTPQSKSS